MFDNRLALGLRELASVARFVDSTPMAIVTANHNGAEGRQVHLWGQPFFRDQAVDLVVIRNNRSQCAALAFVTDKPLERVKNVFQTIVQIEDGEFWIAKVETNLDLKFVVGEY